MLKKCLFGSRFVVIGIVEYLCFPYYLADRVTSVCVCRLYLAMEHSNKQSVGRTDPRRSLGHRALPLPRG